MQPAVSRWGRHGVPAAEADNSKMRAALRRANQLAEIILASTIVSDISLKYRRRYNTTTERGEAPCMKSTGAVGETKTGVSRPGQGAPSGGHDPGEARADAAANVAENAAGAAPVAQV